MNLNYSWIQFALKYFRTITPGENQIKSELNLRKLLQLLTQSTKRIHGFDSSKMNVYWQNSNYKFTSLLKQSFQSSLIKFFFLLSLHRLHLLPRSHRLLRLWKEFIFTSLLNFGISIILHSCTLEVALWRWLSKETTKIYWKPDMNLYYGTMVHETVNKLKKFDLGSAVTELIHC